MNGQECRSTQCLKSFEGLNVRAAASCQRRTSLKEERHVRAKRACDLLEFLRGQRIAEKLVQPEQGDGSVATPSAEARSQRNSLLQMDLHAVLDTSSLQESRRRPVNEIFGTGRQHWFTAGKLDAIGGTIKT